MRSLSAVKLQETSLRAVSGQTDAAQARKIVLYYSNASVAKGKKSVPTAQAKLSDDVEKDLFGGGSLRVGVLARYFTLLKVNVTDVSPKDDRACNGLTAPVVVVTDSEGKQVAALRGKVAEGSLLSAMIAALKKDNINGARIIAKGTAALNVIRKMVDEKARLKQNLAQLGAKLQDEKGAKAKMLEQRQAQMKTELEQIEKALKEAYDQLKSAGEAA